MNNDSNEYSSVRIKDYKRAQKNILQHFQITLTYRFSNKILKRTRVSFFKRIRDIFTKTTEL